MYNRILIAPDKFKGSLTASRFCDIARETLKEIFPCAETVCKPLADGGEGSLDCFVTATGARTVNGRYTGPDGTPVDATFALAGDTAFIEMSQTAGLALTKIRNPLYTTTYGVGEQIAHAVSEGAKKIFLAIGGSATNDAGCGMAAALGWKFLDEEGREFVPTGGTLCKIKNIIPPEKPLGTEVTTLCDVTNPLFGKNGAAHVYAAQKGATESEIEELDRNTVHFNEICKTQGKDLSQIAGGGAAGGLGAGSVFFLDAKLKGGAESFFALTDIKKEISVCDLIITGEGKIDRQTLHGKTVGALYAASQGKGFVAFCGKKEGEVPFECVEINREGLTLEDNLKNTPENLRAALQKRLCRIDCPTV